MPIDVAFFRELPRYSWRFLRIVHGDIISGRNPLRFYIKTYRIYNKHGLNGVASRINQEYFQLKRHSEVIDYAVWLSHREKVEESCSDSGSLISLILIEDDKLDNGVLKTSLESIRRQSYERWELIVIETPASQQSSRGVMTKTLGEDSAVIHTLHSNSARLEEALSRCRGEWVVLLEPTAVLRPDALCEVIKAANANPEAGVIYSDEDKIDKWGDRSDPLFKPDWNPDLLRSTNYISNLCVFRRDVLQAAGTGKGACAANRSYDLILRATSMLQDHQICHIPKVLYHRQVSEEMDELAEAERWESGRLALQAYLDIVVPGAEAGKGIVRHTYKVRYPLTSHPKVSLIIPTRDGYDVLSQCIDSLFAKTLYPDYEIIVVDNQSREAKTLAYLEKIAQLRNVRVIRYDAPFNFSAINNMAVREAEGDIVGFINDDVEIINEGWLDEMVRHAMRPEIGVVGAKLYFDNDTVQHAGVIVSRNKIAGHAHKSYPRDASGYGGRLGVAQNYSAVTAACMIVHKALFEAVGGFEEAHLAVAFNDVDLCLKLENQGYRTLWTPFAEAYHHESVSRGLKDTPEKVDRFEAEAAYMRESWAKRLDHDPYYNPNLCKWRENFSLGEYE